MNLLAHILLSGEDREVIIGNFIGDFIKGNTFREFSSGIRKGILLHRHIDSYTDSHPLVKTSKKHFGAEFGHYRGVIVDILYDHFLSLNWERFSQTPRKTFILSFYDILKSELPTLPPHIQDFSNTIIAGNGLDSYYTETGLTHIFQRLQTKVRGNVSLIEAIDIMRNVKSELNEEFLRFFPQLQAYCKEYLSTFDK
jgi:acyl carrier protein phosphodiesterase